MEITDPRFGSELVTRQGKAHKFDAVECMVSFTRRGAVSAEDTHSLWVSDFAHPGKLIDARTALYLKTDEVRSPMGLNVLAFGSSADRDAARARYHGHDVDWEGLPALLEKRPLNPPSVGEGTLQPHSH
jgi:copper chaperone NosL